MKKCIAIILLVACFFLLAMGGGRQEIPTVPVAKPVTIVGDSLAFGLLVEWKDAEAQSTFGMPVWFFLATVPIKQYNDVIIWAGANNFNYNKPNESIDDVVKEYTDLMKKMNAKRTYCVEVTQVKVPGNDIKNKNIVLFNERLKVLCGDKFIPTADIPLTLKEDNIHPTKEFNVIVKARILEKMKQ